MLAGIRRHTGSLEVIVTTAEVVEAILELPWASGRQA